MDITRTVQDRISAFLQPQKAAIILGPRRVGKTVLMRQIRSAFESAGGKTLLLNGEDYDTHTLLEQRSVANYQRILDGVDLLALDEAQNVPGIGQKLKLMVDEIPHIRIIATGSSAFDLDHQTGEPLVGRSMRFRLFPFTQKELGVTENALQTRQHLEDRLVYGSYPEVIFIQGYEQKAQYLKEIVNSYLLKDILAFEGIKNSGKLLNLLRLVAFQMGSEVSYDELGRQLGMNKNTVEKYLDLLAGTMIIYRLGAYAGNLRKEVTKAGKWYFYDNGIRNAVIGSFSPLALRQDTGLLWESYCVGERIKNGFHQGLDREYFFWRTYDGQEIDLIEKTGGSFAGSSGGGLAAFEFKWTEKKLKVPVAFAKAYPGVEYRQISRENYADFVG
ncbi:MAG: ATP-binding protein [Treponema sp.]|jgi:predicted AAA+ superfamily ATPase|nr:ATP-binding protein [Treponema sp.]